MSPSVVVVGAGAWGRNHVRTFHELGALAGVVEASAPRRDALAGDYPGLPLWDRLEPALAGADGVVIATPAPTHAALARQALRAGKGVLVEKPMTLDASHAQALVEEAEAARKPLMVGHLLMYQPAVQALKAFLDRGGLGRVFRIHQERLKHGRVRPSENVLWSFAPHDVAVLIHLLGGPPLDVQASGAAFLQPGIHDDVHLELGFQDGRSAHIHAGWYWPGTARSLRVFGEKGMVVYDEADQRVVLHRKRLRGGPAPDPLAPVDEGEELLFAGAGEPLRLEDQHFLHCLGRGDTPLSHGRSGLEVVRVLERAQAQLDRTPAVSAQEHP